LAITVPLPVRIFITSRAIILPIIPGIAPTMEISKHREKFKAGKTVHQHAKTF
jgi:hypothetical protein